jgi:propanediol dehydratase large subunit
VTNRLDDPLLLAADAATAAAFGFREIETTVPVLPTRRPTRWPA